MKVKELMGKYGNYEVNEEKLNELLIEPKPKTVWDLKEGDTYYRVDTFGSVNSYKWSGNGGDYYDHIARNIGNIFLTREEAEFELECRKAMTIVNQYAYKFTREEWVDVNKDKYYVGYDYFTREIVIHAVSICRGVEPYFKSRIDAQNCINSIGKDKFVKCVLGVE